MKSIFDRYYKRYDAWYEKNKFAYLSELEALKRIMPKSGKGLEIGVGSGRFSVPLGIRFGLEPCKKMKELASQRGINVIDGTAEKIPLDDNSFDFALLVTTICFLDNIEQAFKEIYRILKAKGSIIIGFIDKESPIGKNYQENKNKNVFYKKAIFYSTAEVITYLKGVGFNNFSFTQTLFKSLNAINTIEPVKEGYGEGSFVVIKANK
jgi:ubiquinone/menaquinone biosynthesis C-methylase UbiE